MGLNEVFKKVTAINQVTELESHKVDLTIVDDIKKLMQLAVNNKEKYNAEALRAVEQIKKAKIIGIEWRTNLQDASKKINDIVNAAKTTGLDVPKEITAYQDIITKGVKDSASYVTKLNDLQMQIPIN